MCSDLRHAYSYRLNFGHDGTFSCGTLHHCSSLASPCITAKLCKEFSNMLEHTWSCKAPYAFNESRELGFFEYTTHWSAMTGAIPKLFCNTIDTWSTILLIVIANPPWPFHDVPYLPITSPDFPFFNSEMQMMGNPSTAPHIRPTIGILPQNNNCRCQTVNADLTLA